MPLTGHRMRSEWDYEYRNFSIGAADVWWSLILTGIFVLVAMLA